MSILIRDAEARDEQHWRRLWQGYTDFYDATVPAHVTAHTWARILNPAAALFCRVAEVEGAVAGFTVNVLHEGSWASAPICYLEDLFVDPAARGHGIGRMLIQDLMERGKAQGWSGLYWHTRTANPARKLYDEFIPADDFVRYRLQL